MKNPIFIAHSGAWNPGRKANTVGAIERAATSGRFAYIEIDVRRSRSDDSATQTPIIFHDETLDKAYEQYNVPISKRHRIGQPVAGLTIDIIRNESIEIATLAEGMRAAKGHPLNIEVKSIEALPSTLQVIGDMIEKYNDWSWEKIVFSSFDTNILYEIKKEAPEAGISMLYGIKSLPRSFGRDYHTLGARWIAFNKYLAPFLSPFAKLLNIDSRAAYTINTPLGVRFLQLFGVTGFATDHIKLPDHFKK